MSISEKTSILVVEDERSVAYIINMVLKTAGYTVVGTAGTGQDAIAMAGQTLPDLVLMDIALPGGVDGIQAAGEIRSRWGIPVIYLSAHSEEATVERARLTEPIGYIIKPFEAKQLLAAISIALHQFRVSRRRAAEELSASEQRYRSVVAAMAEGIVLYGADGRVLDCNASAEKILGLSLDQMLGRTSISPNWRTIHEDGSAFPGETHPGLETLRTGKSCSNVIIGVYRPTGSLVWISVNSEPLIHPGESQPYGVVASFTDITERRLAQEAIQSYASALERRVDERTADLSRVNLELERANHSKDEFLASMSHELRTPLTGILGLAEALQLQTYGSLTEKQIKALSNIESSGRHLLDLINDILDLSKIEAGKLEIHFEPCPVTDICQSSLQLVKGMAQQKRQKISFSTNASEVSVRADARRLKQMLVNLLSNAVKYTPEGGELGLDVAVNEANAAVLFNVWDKGVGITPDELGKLFKPFVQIDSNLARQHTGTGLGLSLVQRMAELHGGSVQVESTPGEGSQFTISLPWVNDELDALAQPGLEPGARLPAPIRDALIVEDNDLDIDHAARILKSLGITYVIQPTIQGALEKAALLYPSAILLDLNLPDGYGLDLLKAFKADARTCDIPVVITSVEEHRSEAFELGAAGYLLKPFSGEDLQTELNRAALARPSDPLLVVEASAAGPLVLIADDSDLILDLVSDFLSSVGYQVITTRSGYAMLDLAPKVRPNILLVDIQMPGMDGIETMQRLRAASDPAVARAPIIAVTALAMAGDREKCLEAGADDYLSKPIALLQLDERIKALLRQPAGG